jgi:cation diffusion facilitator CzcD-associated flavoprotein CzcO
MLRVAVIGAGLAGLCAAIRFKTAGIEPFTVFEKAADVGGVWRENTYPGAGCDIPSCLYSYSFDRSYDGNSGWPRVYATQPEILGYMRRCAHEHGAYQHIEFGTEIVEARFDQAAGCWHLRSAAGRSYAARALVTATGQLSRPRLPRIDGMADFDGQSFHSAQWDHQAALAGRNVAVIGNGCSAVQFVPAVAAQAARLTVFQRSPKWIIPKFDHGFWPLPPHLSQRFPAVQLLRRAAWFAMAETIAYSPIQAGLLGRVLAAQARLHLRRQVPDPALRAQLTPDYPFGCNRMILSNDYYPALMRGNVDLVTAPIRRITRDGIETADGTAHPADTIIYATGFCSTEFLAPIEITGPGGRLNDIWRAGAAAYLGMSIPGLPNLFLLYGPNTSSASNSVVYMLESQVRYVVRCLQVIGEGRQMEVRPEAFGAYQRELGSRLRSTVWQGNCSSWYKTPSGQVTNLWPGRAYRYRLATRRPDLGHYRVS